MDSSLLLICMASARAPLSAAMGQERRRCLTLASQSNLVVSLVGYCRPISCEEVTIFFWRIVIPTVIVQYFSCWGHAWMIVTPQRRSIWGKILVSSIFRWWHMGCTSRTWMPWISWWKMSSQFSTHLITEDFACDNVSSRVFYAMFVWSATLLGWLFSCIPRLKQDSRCTIMVICQSWLPSRN